MIKAILSEKRSGRLVRVKLHRPKDFQRAILQNHVEIVVVLHQSCQRVEHAILSSIAAYLESTMANVSLMVLFEEIDNGKVPENSRLLHLKMP